MVPITTKSSKTLSTVLLQGDTTGTDLTMRQFESAISIIIGRFVISEG